MSNPVLERLNTERSKQLEFIDELLTRVDHDERDLTDSEQKNLTATRERINALDEQIEPLREFEELKEAHTETARTLHPARVNERTPLGSHSEVEYRSAGEYVLDVCRARGAFGSEKDPSAQQRIARAVAPQTTADTPGVLPQPIVGQILDTLDASRPLITSIGPRSLSGIPGTTFSRPKIAQHTKVDKQTAEKTELVSQAMKIESVPFTKATYGGVVNVSRQDIDWTSPSAWDALLRDLANVYSVRTETAVSTAFASGVKQTVARTDDTGEAWATALYSAAALCYATGGRLPDRVWCSVDQWGILGAALDMYRVKTGTTSPSVSNPSLSRFAGVVIDTPRIVVPTLPEGTVILGSASLFEIYEERIGLLSAIEPSLLGVEVAYGGYLTSGFMEAGGFCAITPPTPPATTTSTKSSS